MRRRDFIAGLGATAWPLVARAQQQALPVVGFLYPGARTELIDKRLEAFRRGMAETGFVEGRNIVVEYRFTDNVEDRLSELAADLVRRRAAVILAVGLPAAMVAKAATATI